MTSAIAGVFHGERKVSDPELTRQREALRKQVASLGEELTGIENRGREAALAKRKEGGQVRQTGAAEAAGSVGV